MRIFAPWVRTGAVALLVLIAVPGCESETARERAEVQEKLKKADEQLRTTMISSPSPDTADFDNLKRELEGIVDTISKIKGGASGQQAARSLMIADASAHLGTMDLTRARFLENQSSRQCSKVAQIIQGGLELAALMEGHESLDLSPSRAMLDRDRQELQEQLSDFNDLRSELEGPIADRIDQNTADAEEVEQLRQRSDELLGEARERGHAAGFGSYEQAIVARRQADRIELDIAQREIELDLNLQAEHNYITLNAENAARTIEQIDAAQVALDSFEETGAEVGRRARSTIMSLGEQLQEILDGIDQRMTDTMAPVYESAQQHLERAATEARSAASKAGDNAGAMHMTAARAQETLGQLHWSRAMGIADLRSNYERLATAGRVFSGDDVYDRIDALTQSYNEAIENAKEALNQAKSALSQAGGGGSQTATVAFQQNLDVSLAALDGADISESMQPQSRSESDSDPVAHTEFDAGTSASFASPQDLFAFLNESVAQGNLDAVNAVTNNSTPAGQHLSAISKDASQAMERFFRSAEQQFGAEADPMLQSMRGRMQLSAGVPDLDVAEIVSQDDDHIVYQTPGAPTQFAIIRINGSWMIDGDHAARTLTSGPLGEGAEAMIENIGKVMNQLADQIEDGTITTTAEIGPAMQQAMQSVMGQ